MAQKKESGIISLPLPTCSYCKYALDKKLPANLKLSFYTMSVPAYTMSHNSYYATNAKYMAVGTWLCCRLYSFSHSFVYISLIKHKWDPRPMMVNNTNIKYRYDNLTTATVVGPKTTLFSKVATGKY